MADQQQKVVELVNQKVIPNFPDDKKEIGLLAILEIAAAIVTLFQSCPLLKQQFEQDAQKVLDTINHPNLFNKVRLYLTLKRQCKKSDTLSSLNTIVNAVLKSAQTATKEDVATIFAAVLANPKL